MFMFCFFCVVGWGVIVGDGVWFNLIWKVVSLLGGCVFVVVMDGGYVLVGLCQEKFICVDLCDVIVVICLQVFCGIFGVGLIGKVQYIQDIVVIGYVGGDFLQDSGYYFFDFFCLVCFLEKILS